MLIGTDPDQVPTNADLGELAYLDANYVLPATGGTMTGAINLTANSGYNIYASGTADNYLAGDLTVGALISTGIGVTTGAAGIELGGNRTGDGTSYIDVHSTSGADYETRIIRGTGANGAFQIINTGTGELQLQSANTASITFLTSATERMRIDSAGRIGVNVIPSAGRGLTIAGTGLITGAVNGFSVLSAPVVAADVTGDYNIFRGTTTTAASAFTLANAINFVAAQGVIGAGSSITSQYGFQVNETLIGATSNNWGFVGNIPFGTGRYNLYMAGTAGNYLAGNLGIGTSLASSKLHVRSDANALTILGQFQNRVSGANTGSVLAFINSANDTEDNRYSYIGAVTTGVGQNGNNLVFASNANGQAAVECMRIESSGNIGIGTTSPNLSAILDVQSTTKGVRMPNMTTTQKNAISSPAAGLMVFDTTLSKLCVYSGAAWQTIT
jgi:hypothetical protein